MLLPRAALLLWATPMLLVGGLACSDEDPPATAPPVEPPVALAYVGSEACGYCHSGLFNDFAKTGHPYKLNKVVNGQPPTYPFSTVPSPPAGVAWSNVAYVIGGYGWKARFIGLDGFIITAGGQNQYNLATGGWVDYHTDEVKPFDCGTCHTTGYRGDGHQDGLPGIVGQWAAPGVQCEECHGPGSQHIQSPTAFRLSIDTRSEACGRCHNRGGMNDEIPASGGFIRHHEQYNEMQASVHKVVNCVTCHDPHLTVRYAARTGVNPMKVSCEDCHTGARQSIINSPLGLIKGDFACVDCHMPQASKSALTPSQYVGDIRTHIFKINADSLAEQFDTTGGLSNKWVTSEYACLGCHTDPTDTKAWADTVRTNIHGPGFDVTRIRASAVAR